MTLDKYHQNPTDFHYNSLNEINPRKTIYFGLNVRGIWEFRIFSTALGVSDFRGESALPDYCGFVLGVLIISTDKPLSVDLES